jgi:tRNA-2-methylthio-N6-dimethylallyladenosine synthase
MVTVKITDAAPYHLLADQDADAIYELRRTRAGDAWDAAEAASCGTPTTLGESGAAATVNLGLPGLRSAGH